MAAARHGRCRAPSRRRSIRRSTATRCTCSSCRNGDLEVRTGAVLFANDLDLVATFYSSVLGLTEAGRDHDHIQLESPGFQLVVHRIPGGHSAQGDAPVPPTRRAAA